MRPYTPLVPSGHLLTVAAHYWPRPKLRHPAERRYFETEPGIQVLAEIDRHFSPRATLVLLHGLESSSQAGYMVSMAAAAFDAGFSVVRLNMRSCGGTEHLCRTLYHAGLTADLHAVVRALRAESPAPVFAAGYSLGGNVVLKFAGELGEDGPSRVSGVAAVSTPIDLAACVSRMERLENRLYELRFLRNMKARMRYRRRLMPGVFSIEGLDSIRSVREFDDRITAPASGFSGAAEYYATQSARNFLGRIRVPALLVAAQDDPLIPFEIVEQALLPVRDTVQLWSPTHGGHVGFLSLHRPRFWLDYALLDWFREQMAQLNRPLSTG